MNQSLEVLLYGMQFRRLLEKKLLYLEKEYGLCKIDVQILFHLYSAGESNTPRNIIDLNLFTKSHVSQSLNRMQHQGFITMQHDNKDRRFVHIFLTENANQIIVKVQNAYDQINEIVFRDITQEEKTTFLSVAQKINANIRSVLDE